MRIILIFIPYFTTWEINPIVLELIENTEEPSEFFIYRCNGNKKLCTGNHLMNSKSCESCKRNFDLLIDKIKIVSPRHSISVILETNLDNLRNREIEELVKNVKGINNKELKELNYNNINYGIAMFGELTFLSQDTGNGQIFRNNYLEKMIHDYLQISFEVEKIFKEKSITDVIVFNGRFGEQRIVIETAKKFPEIVLRSFEGYADSHMIINSSAVQDISILINHFNSIRSTLTFQQKEKVKIFLKERVQKGTIYIDSEKKQKRTFFKSSKTRVLVATSSEDENESFDHYLNAKFKQNDFIKALLLDQKKDQFEIVIREHPMQRYLLSYQRVQLFDIVSNSDNCILIKSEENVNTYDLMLECDILIGFDSSTLAEATLLGKPVLSYGDSLYKFMKGFKVCESPDNLIADIIEIQQSYIPEDRLVSASALLYLYNFRQESIKHKYFVKTQKGFGFFIINGEKIFPPKFRQTILSRLISILFNWQTSFSMAFHRRFGYRLLGIKSFRNWFLKRSE